MKSPRTIDPRPPLAPEEFFGLLADRTRLRLLGLLRLGSQLGRELCVGDLVAVLELPQPSVSRHLGRLRRAGWVTVRRRDPWAFYSLAPTAAGGQLARLLELSGAESLSRDSSRLATRLAAGGCCPP